MADAVQTAVGVTGLVRYSGGMYTSSIVSMASSAASSSPTVAVEGMGADSASLHVRGWVQARCKGFTVSVRPGTVALPAAVIGTTLATLSSYPT